MILELDIARFLQLFVIQLIIALIFIYLGVRILLRNRSRLNLSFSAFYLFTAIGALLNVVYSVINIEIAVIILNFITNFSISFSLIFLYCTNQIILKSEVAYTKDEELKAIGLYGLLLLLMICFYPFGQGVIINKTTNWKPVWRLPFFIYVITVVTVVAIIPIIISAIKIYKKFENKQLKSKWIYFMVGLAGLFTYMYGAFINNLLNNQIFRLIFSLFGLTVVVWVYLIYYGIGRQIE
jgi:hypothetical protein